MLKDILVWSLMPASCVTLGQFLVGKPRGRPDDSQEFPVLASVNLWLSEPLIYLVELGCQLPHLPSEEVVGTPEDSGLGRALGAPSCLGRACLISRCGHSFCNLLCARAEVC